MNLQTLRTLKYQVTPWTIAATFVCVYFHYSLRKKLYSMYGDGDIIVFLLSRLKNKFFDILSNTFCDFLFLYYLLYCLYRVAKSKCYKLVVTDPLTETVWWGTADRCHHMDRRERSNKRVPHIRSSPNRQGGTRGLYRRKEAIVRILFLFKYFISPAA